MLSALCATTWQFVAVRLLAGVFAGSVIPLTLVYIGDTVEYARRQVVVGRFSIVTSAGLAFSAAIGGPVGHPPSRRAVLPAPPRIGVLAPAPPLRPAPRPAPPG